MTDFQGLRSDQQSARQVVSDQKIFPMYMFYNMIKFASFSVKALKEQGSLFFKDIIPQAYAKITLDNCLDCKADSNRFTRM